MTGCEDFVTEDRLPRLAWTTDIAGTGARGGSRRHRPRRWGPRCSWGPPTRPPRPSPRGWCADGVPHGDVRVERVLHPGGLTSRSPTRRCGPRPSSSRAPTSSPRARRRRARRRAGCADVLDLTDQEDAVTFGRLLELARRLAARGTRRARPPALRRRAHPVPGPGQPGRAGRAGARAHPRRHRPRGAGGHRSRRRRGDPHLRPCGRRHRPRGGHRWCDEERRHHRHGVDGDRPDPGGRRLTGGRLRRRVPRGATRSAPCPTGPTAPAGGRRRERSSLTPTRPACSGPITTPTSRSTERSRRGARRGTRRAGGTHRERRGLVTDRATRRRRRVRVGRRSGVGLRHGRPR